MGDVSINIQSSESKSRLSSLSAKDNIFYQLKCNDISSTNVLNGKTWRYREILKFTLFILIFFAEPINYYVKKDNINECPFKSCTYKIWLDILLIVFLAIIPFITTMWFSYKSVFVKKVFPWTFGSEILLLLLIVLRSKLVFDKNLMSWISIISYIIVQFYTYHNIILIIPIENILSLIIYMVVYSKELFSNEKFLMNELKFFFPIYLILFTIINVLSKLNIQKGCNNNKLSINSNISKDYEQCNTPAEKAMYICRVVMETPQIEQQDVMLLDKLQASLFDKLMMNDKRSITEKKSRNIQKYSIENTAVIEGNEFDEQYDVPKIEVVSPDSLNKLFCDIDSWDWNVFNYASVVKNPLYYLTRFFFERENLFKQLNIPEKEFNRFIGLIEKGYHDLPFHNKIHATDVLHAMNYLIMNPKIKAMCNTVDIMCCYIAAIIHDYDHPGFSNVYLVNIQDEMAILYNDQRVLENHHLAKAWELLLKPENNFLKNFNKTDFVKIRKLIIELVLATDLSQHNQLLSSFREKVLNNENLNIDDEIKELILKIIIKFADVSNTSKTWSIYTYWFERVMTEFYRQGDLERERGMKISANMDRYDENAPLCQINFIKFICEPINTVVDTYIHDKVIVTNLNYNYKRLVKLEDSKKLKLTEKDFDVSYDDSQ